MELPFDSAQWRSIMQKFTDGSAMQWVIDQQRVLVGVAAVVALVVAAALYVPKLLSGGNPLGVELPKWKQFVVVDARDVPVYKEPSTGSPQLRFASENLDSDVADMMFRWSDEGDKRGYTTRDYLVEQGTVSPVLDERDAWYKIQINGYMAGYVEAWIEKKYCREVKPEPITADVLSQWGSGYSRHDRLVTSGKLKNLVLTIEGNEMDGPFYEVGVLVDGYLVYPLYDAHFPPLDKAEDEFLPDPNNYTDEQVETIYASAMEQQATVYTAYYYFPDVRSGAPFAFFYRTDGGTLTRDRAPESDGDDEITDYIVYNTDDGQSLQAVLGGKTEPTGIVSNRLDVLDTGDYDGDGSLDALVMDVNGGSAGEEPPFVVYYDKRSSQYKRTDTFGPFNNVPDVEELDGRKTFLYRQGLHWERYVFDGSQMQQTESDTKEVGKVVKQWTREALFPNPDEISDDLQLAYDLDGDGADETLLFSHNASHAYDFGQSMFFEKITWGDGRVTERTNLCTAATYAVLDTRTNGVSDLLLDSYYLYRWNGQQYETWAWEGSDFVKQEDASQM